jgi:hypothetical protein
MDTIMTTEEQNQNSTIIQVDFVVCYGWVWQWQW